MTHAVEFEKTDKALVLVYQPQDDDEWVHRKFQRDEELQIKGTYHFTKQDLLPKKPNDPDDFPSEDDHSLRFVIGRLKKDYYILDDRVLEIGVPVWLHKTCKITWKWFTAERRVSIFSLIAKLRPQRIVIGGNDPEAIPEPEYERLLTRLPTTTELHRYSLARVAAVVREYADTEVDAVCMQGWSEWCPPAVWAIAPFVDGWDTVPSTRWDGHPWAYGTDVCGTPE